MVSTVDPEARHIHKNRSRHQDGFKGHVSFEPETGLFTAVALTGGSGPANHEAAVAAGLLAGEQEELTVLGDTAYGTGDLRERLQSGGHALVIKPPPLRPAVPGGFTVDDFTIDDQAGTVTCPAGNTVALSRTRVAAFGTLCRDCPLRARCTTCKTGRKLVLHPRDDLLRAARADWAAGPGLREDYMAHRPNVERAVAQVATWRGRRLKLRYRGTAKNHAWLKRRTAALNLRNLIGKGLTWQAGAWVLAT